MIRRGTDIRSGPCKVHAVHVSYNKVASETKKSTELAHQRISREGIMDHESLRRKYGSAVKILPFLLFCSFLFPSDTASSVGREYGGMCMDLEAMRTGKRRGTVP